MSYQNDISVITDILTRVRPSGSDAEQQLAADYLQPMGYEADPWGNWICGAPDAQIAVCCHLDTVATSSDPRQRVIVGKNGLMALTPTLNKGLEPKFNYRQFSVLGSDDGAGVWLCLEVLKYLSDSVAVWFHSSEEAGMVGSTARADFLYETNGYCPQVIIALDRNGTKDAVYKQVGEFTASEKYTSHLCDTLHFVSDTVIGLKPDPTGMFTDSLAYVDLAEQCLNLSVGYYNAHSSAEVLDLDYLVDMRDGLLELLGQSHLLPHHLEYPRPERQAYPMPNSLFDSKSKWGK